MVVHSGVPNRSSTGTEGQPPREIVDGAWLQVALALSIEISSRDPLTPSAEQQARTDSTDRSGGHETGLAAVHILRIDGWMRVIRRSTNAGVAHGGSGVLDFP